MRNASCVFCSLQFLIRSLHIAVCRLYFVCVITVVTYSHHHLLCDRICIIFYF